MHLVKCGDGWLSWDNSCYRQGTSTDSRWRIEDGIDYCAKEYEAEVFVPNSKDEAEFIGRYLKGSMVIFLGKWSDINYCKHKQF